MVTSLDASANLAQAMLAFRRVRPDELPCGLFSETGWEYLLELFIADAKGERLTGRIIAERCGASEAVAMRWLQHLSTERLVVGEDGKGGLDDVLSLSTGALDHMETLMDRARLLRDRLADASPPTEAEA